MRRAGAVAGLALVVAATLGGCSGGGEARSGRGFGDPDRGKLYVGRQACGSCHLIPGEEQSDGLAGPPLTRFADRAVIAGVLPNTPDNLARWLKSPQSIVPGNAMPDMGLGDQQARDVAAFLETLR